MHVYKYGIRAYDQTEVHAKPRVELKTSKIEVEQLPSLALLNKQTNNGSQLRITVIKRRLPFKLLVFFSGLFLGLVGDGRTIRAPIAVVMIVIVLKRSESLPFPLSSSHFQLQYSSFLRLTIFI